MNKFEDYVSSVRRKGLKENIAPLRKQIKYAWAQKKLSIGQKNMGMTRMKLNKKL